MPRLGSPNPTVNKAGRASWPIDGASLDVLRLIEDAQVPDQTIKGHAIIECRDSVEMVTHLRSPLLGVPPI
ncbi:hypothetical protein JCM10369A_33780 [Nocardioides pyridinolyticus]